MTTLLWASVASTLLLSVAAGVDGQAYENPPPLFSASDFTTWTKDFESSRLATIHVPFTAEDGTADFVEMKRVDLVGDDERTRGRAHGALLAEDIIDFVKVKLPAFYAETVVNMDMSKFPEPLQKLFKIKGALKAPEFFNSAMSWVYEKELPFIPQRLIDEMEGIAEGICYSVDNGMAQSLGKKEESRACNVTEWSEQIKAVNMLPELIRMACTAYGAWGKASGNPEGKLVQTRALDFGNGPWSNFTVVSVQRPASVSDASPMRPFSMVGFPGFVGAITGIAKDGIGISEKVWMVDGEGLQPGCFCGEPDVFVLRDILQNSATRAEAESYVNSINRTWAIFIGVGDFQSQKFDIIGYKRESAVAYDDTTMPTVTEQPYFESVCYVDKHPQPSWDASGGEQYLPDAIQDFYGNITAETSRTILRYHQTGDVHIAVYDFAASEMHVSTGRISGQGGYGPDCPYSEEQEIWKAYNRPYLRFNLEDLWIGK